LKVEVPINELVLHFINPADFENKDKNKIFALIVGITGILVLNALLIPSLNNVIALRVKNIQNGCISYSFNNHYVIIGYDEMTANIIEQIYEKENEENKKKKIGTIKQRSNKMTGKINIDIVVQTDKVKEVRRRLKAELNEDSFNRVVFMHGASDSEDDLKKLCVQKAKRIIILGDDKTEAHDNFNMKCSEKIVELRRETNNRVDCDVLFNNLSTYKIALEISDKNWYEKIYFRPFNFYESWARKVIVFNKVNKQKITYRPLNRKEGILYDSEKSVHFVIMKLDKMGTALAIEAARTMHIPNFKCNNNLKTHITFIDSDAEKKMNDFISRYPYLFESVDFDYADLTQENSVYNPEQKNKKLKSKDFLDIKFSFIKGNPESSQIRNLISKLAEDESTILTIAVCDYGTEKNTAVGLYLPPIVFSKDIPIFIQQKETNSLFTKTENPKYKNIRPFGMINEGLLINDPYEKDPYTRRIAMMYKIYTEKIKSGLNAEISSEAAWKESEKYLDDINENLFKEEIYKDGPANYWGFIRRAFVTNTKKRSFNVENEEINDSYINKNAEKLAEIEHNRWNIEQLLSGDNPEEKKNICPYNNLDQETKNANVCFAKLFFQHYRQRRESK
jgi:hypothetical protein